MKTIFGIKGFALSEYAVSANAILGIRDSGKTYTATEAGEELFDAGVPWIALDPIGVWHNIRIPGKGRGYPVVVAGGRHGDLPLTVKNAGAIVRAAMEAGVSLVIDLFSMELSKADWRRIVRETVEILLHENTDFGLRHVFIEEAAEFVPQRVQDGQVFAAVEKLVRMGGNSKLGCTLINQRSADINKSVLELCANVFVHRQKGKNTLLDLKKWLSMMSLTAAQENKIAESLPDLKSGTCWALLNDIKAPIMLAVPEKNSLHPDRRAASSPDAAKRKPVPADAFVEVMKAKLAPKAKEVPLSVGIALIPDLTPKQLAAQFDAAEARGREAGWSEGYTKGHFDGFFTGKKSAEKAIFSATSELLAPIVQVPKWQQTQKAPNMRLAAIAPLTFKRMDVEPGNLGKAERAILGVLAHFPVGGAARVKVALMAGYSASAGSFSNTLSGLRTKGLLNPGDPLCATDAGIYAIGAPAPLPSGSDLLTYWCGHRSLGKAERAILTALVNALPGQLTRDDVAHATGYAPGAGSFSNSLSRLRTLELISGSRDLKAAEEFA